jgi:fatty-acid desaturase
MRPIVHRVHSNGANASTGRVRVDRVKTLWNGGMLASALLLAPLTFSLGALLLFLVTTYVTLLLGHSVGMHRRLIHRSYDCPKWLERVLVYLGVLVGMAGPFGILRIHDIRDWAQREADCHDFFSHRQPLWRDALWQLTCRFEFDRPPSFSIEAEFANDPFYRWLERTWMLQQVPLALVFYAFGGWSWVVWGVLLRVGVSVSGHWVVTYLTPNPGPSPWAVRDAGVQASNLEGFGLLTMGECWHNNHHAFPESARVGVEHAQTDPGWWVISGLHRVGLVTRVGLPRPAALRGDLLLAAPVRATDQPASALDTPHRVRGNVRSVLDGEVRYSPKKSLWFTSMLLAGLVGGALTFTWAATLTFTVVTALVLLFGHSLGSHRKLIHDSFDCPKWLEYALVYLGVQVGLAGPIGLLRQHELRDFAQRLPDCHRYLRHGSSMWRDAWWQLHCELHLCKPPEIRIEPRIADDRFYRFLERTWMAQQALPAMGLYAIGGWSFVFWGTCLRVVAGVFGHWLVGYFAHNHGHMQYEVKGAAVQGHNVPWASLLTMGESWHNNHHAFPGSARLGLLPGQWDPGWWALVALRKAGLVRSLRLPCDLPRRPELSPVVTARPQGLRDLVRGISTLRALRQPDAISFSGPASYLPALVFQGLAGRRTSFVQSKQSRVEARVDGVVYRGLPALCVVAGARGRLAQCLAMAVAPVAMTAETVRTWVKPSGTTPDPA